MSDDISVSLLEDGPLNVTSRRALFRRLRIRLAVVLAVQFLGIYVPLFLNLPLTELRFATAGTPLVHVTVLWSSIAVVTSFLLIHQISNYPGIYGFSLVLPCSLLVFGALASILFALRFEYSRYVIIAGFFSSTLWMHVDHWLIDRQHKPLLLIVPGGNQRNIASLKSIRLVKLKDPKRAVAGVDAIVADLNSRMSAQWERFIAKSVLAGIPVYDVKSVIESLTGRVEIERLSENSFGSVLPSKLYLRLQRLLDVILAILLAPVVGIIVFVAAVIIKIETPGNIFFKQPRMGYRAVPFTIYKLRSMRNDDVGGKQFTEENDPRITRFGRFIRRFRIDELPQIINIFCGDMSWIGPRPEAIELSEWYARDIPFYVYRHAVRPGITGWAQVMQGNVAEVDAARVKLQYDFYYIKHFSPWLDLLIIFKTVQILLTGFGAK